MYRQNKYEETQNILQKLNCLPAQHLQAQLFYQFNQYKNALKCYEIMDLSNDVLGETNKCACAVKAKSLKIFSKNSLKNSIYHLQNLALGLIKLRKFNKVCKLLAQSIDNSVNLEYPDLIEIKIMLAFSFHRSKNFYQAYKLYNELKKINIKNHFSKLILMFNHLILKETKSVSIYKRFCILLNFKKWMKRNRSTENEINVKIQINYLVMLMKCNQILSCRSRMGQLKINKEIQTLILISLETKKSSNKALKILKRRIQNLKKKGISTDRLKLVYASILIQKKEEKKAMIIIQTINTLRYYPSIIAVFFELFYFTNRKQKYLNVFDEAITYWMKKNNNKDFVEIILGKSLFLLQNSKYKRFIKMYIKLLKSSGINANLKIKLTSSLKLSTYATFNVPLSMNLQIINPFNLIEQGCIEKSKKKKGTVHLNWRITDIVEKNGDYLSKKKI